MGKILWLLLIAAIVVACGKKASPSTVSDTTPVDTVSDTTEDTTEQENDMEPTLLTIEIGGKTLQAEFADTEAAEELKNKLASGPVTITVSNYGGWEKVGDLPWSLPRNDIQTTAVSGDIMLYTGRSIVFFYGENDWAYTRLGRLIEADPVTLEKILGGSDTKLTLSLE